MLFSEQKNLVSQGAFFVRRGACPFSKVADSFPLVTRPFYQQVLPLPKPGRPSARVLRPLREKCHFPARQIHPSAKHIRPSDKKCRQPALVMRSPGKHRVPFPKGAHPSAQKERPF